MRRHLSATLSATLTTAVAPTALAATATSAILATSLATTQPTIFAGAPCMRRCPSTTSSRTCVEIKAGMAGLRGPTGWPTDRQTEKRTA